MIPISLMLAVALAQATTVTRVGAKVGQDVNCIGGCSGSGGSSSGGGTIDGGFVGVSSLPLVFIADAGVLNVNPVAIASAPTLNIGDAGVLNVNFPASQAVTGTFWQAGQNVSIVDAGPPLNVNPVTIASLPLVFIQDAGVLNVNFPVTQAVSAATLPLPSGAATALRQDTANTSLANLDVALSTRTKPADQQHVIVDTVTPTVAVSLASAPTTPITAAALPLPAGAATDSTASQLLDGGVGLLSTIAANQTNGQRTTVIMMQYPLNPFLPRCNPVRRTGCQP